MSGSPLFRLLLLITLTLPAALPAQGGDLSAQRDQYRAAMGALSRGELTRFRKIADGLRDYPLYPWLEYQDLRRRRSSAKAAEVDAFFSRHDDDLVGRYLRASLLDTYYSSKRWADYLRIYRGDDNATDERRCEHAWALLQSGNKVEAFAETTRIWPSPKSLPRTCDPLFERWYAAGNPSTELAWQRFHLAVNAGQSHLANYLMRYLDSAMTTDARLYLAIRQDPRRVERIKPSADVSSRDAQMIEYGIDRLARKHARDASKLFRQYLDAGALGDEAARALTRRISISLASGKPEDALEWSLGLPDKVRGDDLSEDTVRYALRTGSWNAVPEAIDRLPPRARNEDRWQYWNLREPALLGTSERTPAERWRTLADKRNYYAFLAADNAGVPYAMEHVPVPASAADMDAIRAVPGIARALEFDAIGESLQSRREWFHTITRLTPRQRELAARIAHEKGWHQLAMGALISAESWNDLGIRFPALYTDEFQSAAGKVDVETTWLFAIARQESMFDTNARSPAGAMGLMQLMPATASSTARAFGIRYGGSKDLRNPSTNVSLGSRYMKSMLNDFSNNRALAAAAYNAGPSRVKQWLRSMPAEIPHDVFVESIPFRETRQYVQNTLSFAVIYAYLQGNQAPLMHEHELIIVNPAAAKH